MSRPASTGVKIPRSSGFRHVTGTGALQPVYTGLQVNSTASSPLTVSASHVAIPWRSAGAPVHARALGSGGTTQQYTLNAHTAPISCLQFSPYKDNLLATGANDRSVFLWSLQGTNSEVQPTTGLIGHEKKLTFLQFHPTCDRVLATGSADNTMKVWDIESGVDCITMNHGDVVTDLSWTWEGDVCATSAQDNALRVLDPRSARCVAKGQPHTSTKGFRVTWLGDTSMLVTAGFGEKSMREIRLWDTRKGLAPEHCLQTVENGVGANVLLLHYDPGCRVLYSTSKSESVVKIYDITVESDIIQHACDIKMPTSHSAVAYMPKRAMDVSKCEISRILRLAGSDKIDTQSLRVPRKGTLFQEDLYELVIGTEGSIDFDTWSKPPKKGKGKLVSCPPKCISMKPEGAKSVYDAEGSGGKPVKQRRAVAGEVSGAEHHTGCLLLKSDKKDAKGIGRVRNHTIFLFENPETASAILDLPIQSIRSMDSSSDTSFAIEDLSGTVHELKCRNAGQAELWQKVIRSLIAKPAPPEVRISCEGYLKKLAKDSNSKWQKRWFRLKAGILTYQENPSSEKIKGNFHLEKVMGVRQSADGVISNAAKDSLCFQLDTPERVLFLQATDDADYDSWLLLLEAQRQAYVKAADEHATIVDHTVKDERGSAAPSGVVEGYLQFRAGSGWQRRFVSLKGGTSIHLFKSHKSASALEKLNFADMVSIDELSDKAFSIQYSAPGGKARRFQFEVEDGSAVDFMSWYTTLTKYLLDHQDLLQIIGVPTEPDAVKAVEGKAPKLDLVAVRKGEKPMLFRVSRVRHARAQYVPLTVKSLAANCVFVLDAGSTLYQWNGPACSRVAKAKGLDVISRIRREERGNTARIVLVNEIANKKDQEMKDFCKLLGCKSLPSKFPELDVQPENMKVFRVVDTGPPREHVRLVYTGTSASNTVLDTSASFVVDGGCEIHLWTGAKSTPGSRKLAMTLAATLFTQSKRANHASIIKVPENGETVLFKEKFTDYPGMLPIGVSKKEVRANVARAKPQPELDVKGMVARVTPDEQTIDNAKGTVKIWWADEADKKPLPTDLYGTFFTQDSYVVLYTYRERNTDSHILYYWQGLDCRQKEKGASALHTVDLAQEIEGEAVQVRVVQGKEPLHFLMMFKGKYTVQNGSWTSYKGWPAMHAKPALFDVRGSTPDRVRGVQLRDVPSLSDLSSFAAYTIFHEKDILVWKGSQCSSAESSFATALAKRLGGGNKVTSVSEGKEPANIVTALQGGTRVASKAKRSATRLVRFSGQSGVVVMEEVDHPSQSDLNARDLFLVDCPGHENLWLYITPQSKDSELKVTVGAALLFESLTSKPHNRTKPIEATYPGGEPSSFTAAFQAWRPSAQASEVKTTLVSQLADAFKKTVYTYDELLQDPLPKGVDPTKLETYLSDEEFSEILGLSREEFGKLPDWQQKSKKEDKFLF